MEQGHAKNSAQLVQLSLTHCRTWVGETLDAVALGALSPCGKKPVLLYPQSPGEPLPQPPIFVADARLDPAEVLLVVLDGTWRKSRKMLYKNPVLQTLPRLALPATGVSRYSIRKAHRAGQFSTLEAVCSALTLLEGQTERYVPLLMGFAGFVEQQAANAGPRRTGHSEGSQV